MPKTWRQKLDGGQPAHVEVLEKAFGGALAGAKMLVATPRMVDDYIRNVPAGETRSIAQMRIDLAQAHGAEISCPISTSIFARIAAEAALEETGSGVPLSEVTPFWRVIDEQSPIAKKLSCGVDMLREQREREVALAQLPTMKSRGLPPAASERN